MTSSQSQLFGTPPTSNASTNPVCGGNDGSNPLLLSPYIIEQLLRPLPRVDGRNQQTPPPPESVITINDRNGVLEISNQYQTTYQNGRGALAGLYSGLETANASQDSAEIQRLLDGSASRLSTFSNAATTIRDVRTRHNLSEYSVIEGWLSQLYAQRHGTPLSTPNPNASESISVEGLMLGFNMAAINKADPTYRTGTAVKLLIVREAQAAASELGGGARALGLWGTNIVVAGIPAASAADFRRTVLRRVLNFLRTDQPLPSDIANQIGTSSLRTSDLAGRAWVTANDTNIGLTAGHRSAMIDAANFEPNNPRFVQGQADIDIIRLISGMAEGEMEARRLGRPVFTGEVSETSPVHGKGGRPLLRTDAILPVGTAPHEVDPLPEPDLNAPRSTIPTLEDIQSGRMPRPSHDAGHSIAQAQHLSDLLAQAQAAAQSGDLDRAHQIVGEAMQYLNNPENRAPDQRPQSMLEFYDTSYENSNQQDRFRPVYNKGVFPQIAERVFNGERFFIQMAEYRDYWGHNRTHAPDPGDSMHRLTMDILARGYEYHGLEVLIGTQGGDEVYFAIRGRTSDGHEMTDADMARVSDYLTNNFNRIFQNVVHHEVTKVPLLPGGRFAGRNYLVQDGKVIVERGAYTPDQIPELLQAVETAYGQHIDASNVQEVESLSKVGQVERLRLWSRVDQASGRVIEVFRPLGETPEGYTEVRIPLSTTVTSAVEIPAGSSPEVVLLAMDRAGRQADQMKREGFDRPRAPGAPASEGPDVVVRMSLADRMNATREGRIIYHAGLFAGADFVTEGIMQIATGQSRLFSADFYSQMVSNYAIMALGSAGGETATRALYAMMDRSLIAQGTNGRILNTAALRTEYTGARAAGIYGAGILASVILGELVQSGRVDVDETLHTLRVMGEGEVLARGATYGSVYALEATGLISSESASSFLAGPEVGIPVVLGSLLWMKLRAHWDAQECLRQTESGIKNRLGRAMRHLDFTIARGTLTRADGTIDPQARQEYERAVSDVTNAFGDWMMFRFAHDSDEGRAYLEAQQDFAEHQAAKDQLLNDHYPELRARIQADPSHETQILQRWASTQRSMDFGGQMVPDYPIVEHYLEARRGLARAQTAFQKMVRQRLKHAPQRSFPVPLHQDADAFSAGLRSNPLEIFQQFQSYFVTRMAYADEIRVRGPDTAAIQSHYAPSPPPPPTTVDLTTLLNPAGQTANNFLNFFPYGSLANQPFSFFNAPGSIQSGGANVFVLPTGNNGMDWTNGIELSTLRPTGTTAAATKSTGMPLFYMDGQGRLRPMQASDQPTAGAIWYLNPTTRRYEMQHTPIVIDPNAGNNMPVIDLSPRLTSLENAYTAPRVGGRALPIISLDETSPRPVVRTTTD